MRIALLLAAAPNGAQVPRHLMPSIEIRPRADIRYLRTDSITKYKNTFDSSRKTNSLRYIHWYNINQIAIMNYVSLLLLGTAITSAYAKNGVSPAELAEIKAAFQTSELVPDVLPNFCPTALAGITFTYANGSSSGPLAPGTLVPRNDTAIRPTFTLRGVDKKGTYIGVIVDPDAPSRRTPNFRNIRHLLAPNLHIKHGHTLVNTTSAASEYRQPSPPAGSGPHRYTFLVYQQPKGFEIVDGVGGLNLSDIRAWNLTRWTEAAGLGQPIAGTWFESEVSAA
ncbi:phosphatidylethanolamine-binding protein [Geopyxis carbonaria]|nr:phosphatidylethanolamine-binding protein [Geopyxis carbonaria]